MTTEIEANAHEIHAAYRKMVDACKRNDDLPKKLIKKGWSFVYAGCSRSAYLGPDGFVYKVSRPGSWQSNEQEFGVYIKALAYTLPPLFNLPAFDYIPIEGEWGGRPIDGVQVVEYVRPYGDDPRHEESFKALDKHDENDVHPRTLLWNATERLLGADWHPVNYIWDGKQINIIDMGMC